MNNLTLDDLIHWHNDQMITFHRRHKMAFQSSRDRRCSIHTRDEHTKAAAAALNRSQFHEHAMELLKTLKHLEAK